MSILFVVPVKLLIDFLMKKLLTNSLNNSSQGKICTIWIVGLKEILYRKLIECEGLKQSLIRTSLVMKTTNYGTKESPDLFSIPKQLKVRVYKRIKLRLY